MTDLIDLSPYQIQLAKLLAVKEARQNHRFRRYFPDCGPGCDSDSPDPAKHKWLTPGDGSIGIPCRALYRKHVQYMKAGGIRGTGKAKPNQRLFLAANRIGKTETVTYEGTCHLTGIYPAWWEGRRFDKPVRAWASGDTTETTRDILQVAFLGPIDTVDTKQWCGMIPSHLIQNVTRATGGTPKCIDTIQVKHVSGGTSILSFKSHDQGRRAFQGTEQDLIILDEEPPDDVYAECLIRLMTTAGLLMTSMTPLEGLTTFIKQYLETAVLIGADGVERPADVAVFDEDQKGKAVEKPRTRYVLSATWDDAPHLDDESKEILWDGIPEFQRDARTKGIPQLGAGAIYPFPESLFKVPFKEEFDPPAHWPRCWGLDCALGGTTAAVWGALNRDTDELYLYSAYKRAQTDTGTHATAFRGRGIWIPGVADAAGTINENRTRFIQQYRAEGFDLVLPDKAVEVGIQDVYNRIKAKKLRVFASCTDWFDEYRLYHRDEDGRVVKEHDHLMDASRYLVRSGLRRAKLRPNQLDQDKPRPYDMHQMQNNWMG